MLVQFNKLVKSCIACTVLYSWLDSFCWSGAQIRYVFVIVCAQLELFSGDGGDREELNSSNILAVNVSSHQALTLTAAKRVSRIYGDILN